MVRSPILRVLIVAVLLPLAGPSPSAAFDDDGHFYTTTVLQYSRAKDHRLGWLYEQIGQFDHVDRSLTLLLLDGYSYREMAEILGISESHVGVKINRIKTHLKNLTKEE